MSLLLFSQTDKYNEGRGLVWEVLTHQEMALSWISTNKNIHAKDKAAELCAHLPPYSQQHLQVTS